MPVITITSDIGTQDYFVGAMKAMIYQSCPDFHVIDVSHEIPPFDLPQTAYLLSNVIRHLPSKSYHFIMVDLFNKQEQPFLLCHYNGDYFFSPNNGILPMMFRKEDLEAYQIITDRRMNTLDIFNRYLETTLSLESGLGPEMLGEKIDHLVVQRSLMPNIREDFMEGHIIFIDRFENVIVNITRDQFEEARRGRGFKIYVMRDEFITQIHNNYSEVSEGGKVAFFNTAGYLEIAINKGNAAGLFGLQKFSARRQKINPGFHSNLYYESIKIYFE